MPCRNEYDDVKPKTSYNDNTNHISKNNEYEAGFCALANAIEKSNGIEILRGLLKSATQNSGMDIEHLYEQHLQKDIYRLEKEICNHSIDELQLLQKIIENKLNGKTN